MKVLKASAGSGKTYMLSKTYIDKLLSSTDRYEYRHILAVTFTNKATAEMKGRILSDLYKLSKTNPKAKLILTDILHDYAAFSVSTIDKFFQQALKAFSREIGQFSAYQVELDKDSLIKEATDRILDGLTEDKGDVVDWLKHNVETSIEHGERFSLDEGLVDTGKRLKNDEHRELLEKHGVSDAQQFGKARLARIREICRKTIDSFHADVKDAAIAVAPCVTKAKAKELLEHYVHGFKSWETVPAPKVTLMKECAGSAFEELFGRRFREYNTVRMIDDVLFSLGLSGEFLGEFGSLIKEKNVMPLDDSNTILRDIIDGSDAPFVYEKLGVRYTDFLLDEFQDTSNIQWKNFLPLLKESESCGNDNLVVGDVKQSIYRWRNSDWRLLGEEVGRQFPDARQEPLNNNWRSVRNVVEFNNAFFTYAAARTGTSGIYSDVSQTVMSKDTQEGGVRVSFVEDELQAVLDSVLRASEAGAGWGDIAILVRNKKEGSMVASKLIENAIPVISDDSLSLKSSLVVRRLVSLLHSFENPSNSVGGYLASSMGVEFPDSYHSLIDLSESLLRSIRDFDPDSFAGETLFIQAFMDDLQSWVQVNGNNLRYYLKHWDDSDLYIGSPASSGSVRVLTIHKSKGLEFPYVIFPFAEKVPLYKADVHWCWLDAEKHGLDGELSGLYPIRLGNAAADTFFSDSYLEERKMQTIDNINVFYVAFTRAGKYLHVIAGSPAQKCVANSCKEDYVFNNFAEVLYAYCGATEWETGTMYDFRRMERPQAPAEQVFPSSYPSIPLSGRLAASEDAMDYFGEDGTTGIGASARLKGIVLHDILSGVRVLADVQPRVDVAVRAGRLSAEEGRDAMLELQARVGAHPEWFSEAMTVRNEKSVYSADGKENRPDRVVLNGGGVIIVDYKFGSEDPQYLRQVKRYMNLYRGMGYANVSGVVWYVREDKVINVE